MDTYYIDGKYVAADEATIPANDLAVLRGYGVFDFLRTYGGKPFRLEAHLQRLARSAQLIGMDELPWTQAELQQVVMETLARNDHDESTIRIVVTGGSSIDNLMPNDEPRLLVLAAQLVEQPAALYTEGVKVILNHDERYLPSAKSINYIPAIIAMKKARAAEAIEAIYVDREGMVREGTTSNIFAVFDGQVLTPDVDVLSGITRGVVMELTDVEVRDIPEDELLQADELFITTSSKEVIPVVQVDDTTIGDGVPGAETRRIMEVFRDYARGLDTGRE